MIPLLLVPGTLCDQRLWRYQIEDLSDIADCRVADVSQDDSLPGMAQRALADADTPEHFALAGFSLGAMVALEIYRQAPERVSHLALLDGTPYPDLTHRREARFTLLRQLREQSMEQIMRDTLLPVYLPPNRQKDASIVDVIIEMGVELGAEVLERQTRALLNRDDYNGLFTHISCPTLALCGDADQLCRPQWYTTMTARMPQAECVIIPDSGHFTVLEQPDLVNTALRRWLETAATTG
ncbi:MAG: alpha/beta hydrolase [Candidatus Competibacteraceae bacterium]|nr:alpha/beta hydrolase [Candidatus Competibacteraceae bacterium]MCB1808958.1 alpha/beta hydrolase [Candidatus Competibacteraceae bacterium]MCB1812563.1 alpha/beta hydrolase [Candidatus Competibacteraceae bacterium]